MLLILGQVIACTNLSWLIKSVDVCHDENVGPVEKHQFIHATNVVPVHQERADAKDCDKLVTHSHQTENALGQVAHAEVLEASTHVGDVLARLQQTRVVCVVQSNEGAVLVFLDEADLGVESVVEVDTGPDSAHQAARDEPANAHATLQRHLLIRLLRMSRVLVDQLLIRQRIVITGWLL